MAVSDRHGSAIKLPLNNKIKTGKPSTLLELACYSRWHPLRKGAA